MSKSERNRLNEKLAVVFSGRERFVLNLLLCTRTLYYPPDPILF